MKVAIAHDFVRHGGAEKVLEDFHLIWPQAPIYTLHSEQLPQYADWDIRSSWLQSFVPADKYRWPFPLYPSLIDKMSRRIDWDVDLLVSSSVSYSKNVVTPEGVPHLCYIHRPAMFAYDRRDMFLSGYPRPLHPLLNYFCNRFQSWDQRHGANPDLFIANSQYIADYVKQFYKVDARVIYPGVNIGPFIEAGLATEPGDYYFCAVRLEGYKRVDLIIEACNRLQIKLKIAGNGPMREALEKQAGPTIEFLGFVEDAEMAGLYANSKGFLFPSEEDFGIAPVEALAAGRPVVALKKGGTQETVQHGSTGVHFKEQSLEEIMTALQTAEDSTWDASAIRDSAQQFSNESFRHKISEVAKEIVAAK
ncbi:MAG: glycosyltransferase [Planctomycetota bacterium]|jgi:glycosyltransferase involved in cell wall biosynthesis|nr:glycosyltransferase [Planctomycetota bacterium]